MIGIDRLYKLIADINVSADPELWYILRGGTEGDWDCEKNDDKTLSSTLAAIANQIKREQGGRVSRMRVLAVVTDMERHCLGHEGMEDSPVARWSRELREALGGEKHDPAADVSVSAYDLLPQEDREAIAWVRDHGGLDAVKRRWECLSYYADPVPRSCMEKRLARLQRQIDESHAALRRRNQRIAILASELNRAHNVMPDGCEWPRYESGDLVMFGDWVENCNGTCTVNSVRFYSGGGVSVYGEDRGAQFVVVTEPVMRDSIRKARPKVFAADGEPLAVGQTVWHVDTGDEFYVSCFSGWTANVSDKKGGGLQLLPSQLTHQRPVLDADGVPIKVGEHVWDDHGEELVVLGLSGGLVRCRFNGETCIDSVDDDKWEPSQLTHEPPDSWERIEEDAGCTAAKYNERRGTIFTTKQQVARDLVRRCRALAERERGDI